MDARVDVVVRRDGPTVDSCLRFSVDSYFFTSVDGCLLTSVEPCLLPSKDLWLLLSVDPFLLPSAGVLGRLESTNPYDCGGAVFTVR